MIYYELKMVRDVFVMSKGHGALAQYVILEEFGLIDLKEYGKGNIGAHPDLGVPGIMASTGSLGHGLGMAVGMAYAERLKGSSVNIYALMSDGELQEGSTWEAVQMAANLKLHNLILFVDLNDFGGLERISESHPAVYPVVEKFTAFGWESLSGNGHNARGMNSLLNQRVGNKPFALIAQTVKGKGVSYMEHVPIWHYRSPNKAEYELAMKELA